MVVGFTTTCAISAYHLVKFAKGRICIVVIGLVWFMLFNVTFNNISVISWRSVLLVEENGVPGENHSSH
jgi:hypothetical protein